VHQDSHKRNSIRLAQRRSYVTIRASGIMLAILALGHFWVMHIATDVAQTDASFIAKRWTSALWVTWDGLLLVATLVHAFAGMHVVIRDYRTKPQSRRRWIRALGGFTLISFLVGIVTILCSFL
jgi:succinate dehydrogenase hydrophobic anchor subunit